MGASLALAGVTACTRQPDEKIVPYVRQPEEIVPGKPLFFATAMPLGGVRAPAARREPRGPPDEDRRAIPITRRAWGAPTPFAQASILALYDPDRSQTLLDWPRDPPVERLPDGDQRPRSTPGARREARGFGSSPAP